MSVPGSSYETRTHFATLADVSKSGPWRTLAILRFQTWVACVSNSSSLCPLTSCRQFLLRRIACLLQAPCRACAEARTWCHGRSATQGSIRLCAIRALGKARRLRDQSADRPIPTVESRLETAPKSHCLLEALQISELTVERSVVRGSQVPAPDRLWINDSWSPSYQPSQQVVSRSETNTTMQFAHVVLQLGCARHSVVEKGIPTVVKLLERCVRDTLVENEPSASEVVGGPPGEVVEVTSAGGEIGQQVPRRPTARQVPLLEVRV